MKAPPIAESASAPIRIELPFGSGGESVNAWLFPGPEPVLIDTGDGEPATWDRLVHALHAHGVSVAKLAHLYITHVHIDHFGQAARLAEESDVQIHILDRNLPWLTDFTQQWAHRLDYYRSHFLPRTGLQTEHIAQAVEASERILAAYRGVPAARVQPFGAGSHHRFGDLAWQAIHTPGHADGLTCFYQPQTRQFLSADMLLAKTPTPVVDPLPGTQKRVRALPLFLRSLRRVEALDIDVTYPGHGAIIPDHRALIQAQRTRIEQRMAECLGYIEQGQATVADLLAQMYPLRNGRINMAGLWMLIGYLDILEERGKISRVLVNGVDQYGKSSAADRFDDQSSSAGTNL